MRFVTQLTLILAMLNVASASDPTKQRIEFNSERIGVLGIPLPESNKPAYQINLTGELIDNKEGKGVLILDMTEAPAYDEFGFVTTLAPVQEMRLDCAFTLVKTTTKVYTARIGGPGSDKYEEQRDTWNLYSITGPKIKSRIFLVLPEKTSWPTGRLLVLGQDGMVKHVISLMLPPQPEPCHPGCFPPGTKVRTPQGTALIEQLQLGDTVTTFGADGRITTVKVEGVFETRNRVLEIRTGNGTLVTTETQPLALAEGGYRSASELKVGDRVWRWSGEERVATTVSAVSVANRDSKVFNLVLGTPTAFVADDFLVRSKPPTDTVRP